MLPITEIQEVHKSPIFENIEYCLKIIAFPVDGEGHKWEYFNIVLQNNNGPCPLIAICKNVLKYIDRFR